MLELRDCRVDLDRGLVVRGAEEIALTTLETELLRYLSARPRIAISRDELHRAVWGIGRAVVTRALDNTVQRLRAKIGDPSRKPRHLLTVYGEGYKFVPLDTPVDDRAGLPPETDRFVGRTRELAALSEAIARPGLVALVGPAGAGKTRTAVRVATGFAGRAVFAGLVAAREPGQAVQAVARALGISASEGASSLSEATERVLADAGRILLVLDNVEQLAGAATLCAHLAEAAPQATVLATSRVPLGAGEQVVALGPLGFPDALALLVDRAGRASGPIPEGVGRRIVERLDGLPLAIELAAPRLGVLPPERLLAHLDDRFALLRSATAATAARAGSADRGVLWQTLEWSWELLEPELRALLGSLSILPGPFRAADAAALAGIGEAEAADGLDRLRARSLIHVATEDRRIAPYEGVRAHARGRADPGEAQQRAIEAYGELARALVDAADGTDGPTARRELAAQRDNIAAALELAVAARSSHAVNLAQAASPLVSGTGALEPWIAQLDRALSVTPAGELWHARAEASRLLGQNDAAEADLARARAAGDPRAAARALASRGTLLRQIGREREALAVLAEAVGLLDGLGERRWKGITLGSMGVALSALGREEEALASTDEAARVLEDSPRNQAIVLGNLGVMHLRAGRLAEALACFEDAIDIHARWGDTRNYAIALTNRGAARIELGRLDEAEADLGEAASLARRAGERRAEAAARIDLGIILLDRGCFAEAAAALREASRSTLALQDRGAAAHALGNLGVARLLQGHAVDARADLDRACALARETGLGELVDLWTAWTAVADGRRPDPPSRRGAIGAAIRVLAGGSADDAERHRSVHVRQACAWRGRG